MKVEFLTKVAVCLSVALFCLYGSIEKQNELTRLRIKLPELAKKVESLREENTRFLYEIKQFNSPQHLMGLARGKEFSHLKYPRIGEVLVAPEGEALREATIATTSSQIPPVHKIKSTVALGSGR